MRRNMHLWKILDEKPLLRNMSEGKVLSEERVEAKARNALIWPVLGIRVTWVGNALCSHG